MSFGHLRPAEARKPDLKILPDERRRLTRYRTLNTGARMTDGLRQAWGTVDEGPATAAQLTEGMAGLRLIDQFTQADPEGRPLPVWVEVYEQIHETDETRVGRNTVIKLEDGRTAIEAEWIQFSAAAATPGTVGIATAPGDSSAFLQKEEATDDGALRRIKRTYVYAGIIQQQDQLKNDGKLLIRTLTYVKDVPPTPSGFVLFATAAQPVNGIPVYTYSFAKGEGEITRREDYSQSKNQGTTGVTRTTITHLTVSSVASQPTSLAGSVLIGADKQDQDGYRVWTVTYAKGTGLVAQGIDSRTDGLRDVTYVSLGTRLVPTPGVVVRDNEREEAGFTVYTVTARQSAAGGAVTDGSFSSPVTVPFLYPGRAKAYSKTAANGWTIIDVFRSPPIQTEVEATVTISYQTSADLGFLPASRWQPREWACIEAEFISLNNRPYFVIQALPGYRSVSETPITYNADIWADDVDGTMLGAIIYGDTTAKLTVFGGPPDPGAVGANNWVLDARLDLAFTDVGGTKYYRKVVVTATIPAQEALPV